MTSQWIEVVNPWDLSPVGRVAQRPWAQIDAWLEQAHQQVRQVQPKRPMHQRIAILEAIIKQMQGQSGELALLIASEGGKPLMDAQVEVARAIDGVRLCIEELGHLAGAQIPMDRTAAGAGRSAYSLKEPIGVVVAVSAFNHPLNLIVHQVAPAIAVGCPIVVKPAATTPLCCERFVQFAHQAGLAVEELLYAPCDNDTAERMVTDPRVAFFSFIGSARVGWMLRSKLAPGTRCALEHGGAAPVIVDASADLATVLPALLKGGFYHAGQVCVSVQRVFAHHTIARQLAEQLASAAQALKVGNAVEADTEVGPLITPREVARVASWVSDAVDQGGELLCGGKVITTSGVSEATAYAPTVVWDPPASATLSQNEVFGPVVAVFPYSDLAQAIAQANALPYAFQAACFSQDVAVVNQVVAGIDASAVMINDHTAFRVDWMPFAGRRHSGYGVGGIGHTMADMTQDKLVVQRSEP
ncbi:aldehyde dehydrogenase family protein [Ferrimonas marina]|uniref:Acyl-CoA reductase n=1 Tax=Ferrimonas marina TaxID=299255 RepID=A0A1M5N0T4_9GAMM|nr:aldehyde dehydrogenase family protein [Ferrimonas marina]SHG83151.1 Acyl-CoA reductase [Ferrimonas marina]